MMLNPHTFRATECRREPHMPAAAGVESFYKKRRKHDWHLRCMHVLQSVWRGGKNLIRAVGYMKSTIFALYIRVLTLVCTNYRLGTSLKKYIKMSNYKFYLCVGHERQTLEDKHPSTASLLLICCCHINM